MLRGEVWLINLDPTLGAEIKKTRPAIIVNRDAVGSLPLRVIVPLTERKPHHFRIRWMVPIDPDPQNGLTKASTADTFQVRSVDEWRFVRRLGKVGEGVMQAIERALAGVFGIRMKE
jgi:mRNA interferase MazF